MRACLRPVHSSGEHKSSPETCPVGREQCEQHNQTQDPYFLADFFHNGIPMIGKQGFEIKRSQWYTLLTSTAVCNQYQPAVLCLPWQLNAD